MDGWIRMDGWMDGWVDEDGWMNEWMIPYHLMVPL